MQVPVADALVSSHADWVETIASALDAYIREYGFVCVYMGAWCRGVNVCEAIIVTPPSPRFVRPSRHPLTGLGLVFADSSRDVAAIAKALRQREHRT